MEKKAYLAMEQSRASASNKPTKKDEKFKLHEVEVRGVGANYEKVGTEEPKKVDVEIQRLRDAGFTVDGAGFVRVYTQAYRRHDRGLPFGGIGVWFAHRHPSNISARTTTNDHDYHNCRARIEAATKAVLAAKAAGITKLQICSPSKDLYLKCANTFGIWKAKEWGTWYSYSTYKKEMQELAKAQSGMQTWWVLLEKDDGGSKAAKWRPGPEGILEAEEGRDPCVN